MLLYPLFFMEKILTLQPNPNVILDINYETLPRESRSNIWPSRISTEIRRAHCKTPLVISQQRKGLLRKNVRGAFEVFTNDNGYMYPLNYDLDNKALDNLSPVLLRPSLGFCVVLWLVSSSGTTAVSWVLCCSFGRT
jgi:hypothetical protein